MSGFLIAFRLPYFNSRPSARGDPRRRSCRHRRADFNSRPSARGDCRFACCFLAFCISIHAPPRGATLPFCVLFSCLLYFNSRPSARGDNMRRLYIMRRGISIHAPPRGATIAEVVDKILFHTISN